MIALHKYLGLVFVTREYEAHVEYNRLNYDCNKSVDRIQESVTHYLR